MPIANCIAPAAILSASAVDDMTRTWSEASGVGPEHMTINLVARTAQVGAAYEAMVFLYPPSTWRADQVRDLQAGLATAVCRHLDLTPPEVHVLTTMVESGHVLDDGEIQEW